MDRSDILAHATFGLYTGFLDPGYHTRQCLLASPCSGNFTGTKDAILSRPLPDLALPKMKSVQRYISDTAESNFARNYINSKENFLRYKI
jgi:hypothetical protein